LEGGAVVQNTLKRGAKKEEVQESNSMHEERKRNEKSSHPEILVKKSNGQNREDLAIESNVNWCTRNQEQVPEVSRQAGKTFKKRFRKTRTREVENMTSPGPRPS